ncbi:MAG: DUF4249 family protein [Hymenobacter sp.]
MPNSPNAPTPPSSKLYYLYSILVRQYALTPEEFAYWDKLRKNTENLGTLFDPLPSQLSGNVHRLTMPASWCWATWGPAR